MKTIGFLSLILLASACNAYQGGSYYPVELQDEKAVYFKSPKFSVHADGISDDATALQKAINMVEEKYGVGIVFVPSGTYCLKETVYLWKGIRLIGYGAERPLFILPENCPGYSGDTIRYMIQFCDARPEKGQPIVDAKNTTFYSGMNNINLQIKPGNPSAAGIRFRVAQLSALEHMDFRLESGLAAVENVGNEIEDCRFYGGQYGIKTMITSPSWQFLLLDCTFEGQEKSAILTHEAGMTVIRNRFADVPHVVEIAEGKIEKLVVENSVCTDITESALLVSEPDKATNQLNVKNVVCDGCPVFLSFRGKEKSVESPSKRYMVKSLVHGLILEAGEDSVTGRINTRVNMQPASQEPVVAEKDLPSVPPVKEWVSVKRFGAKGDGETDDTGALQKAIDEADYLYFPMGRYVISNTLNLRKETCLIGLHPRATYFELKDRAGRFDDKDTQGDDQRAAGRQQPHHRPGIRFRGASRRG